MSDGFHPSHPVEQRGRELDSGWLRRVREMSLHALQLERAAHQRLYHGGVEHGGCWKCRAIARRRDRLQAKVPSAAR